MRVENVSILKVAAEVSAELSEFARECAAEREGKGEEARKNETG